jgi:hypothetical protein
MPDLTAARSGEAVAYVSISQHTSAYVGERGAYVSIRQHTLRRMPDLMAARRGRGKRAAELDTYADVC